MMGKVFSLMDDIPLIEKLGKNAYETIATLWNPSNAAKQLIRFYENYIDNNIDPPKEGPMSVAEDIKPV